jgi:hypothetical protein
MMILLIIIAVLLFLIAIVVNPVGVGNVMKLVIWLALAAGGVILFLL